jgi:hypothetical protein
MNSRSLHGRAIAELQATTEQPEEAVLVGPEEACGACLLQEDGDDACAVAHAVIREAVSADRHADAAVHSSNEVKQMAVPSG